MKTCDSRFSKCLYFASGVLSRKVEKLASECFKPSGLSPSLGYLLLAVIEEPGIQPKQLTEQLQLTPSTITRLMDKLEEKRLLVRTSEGKLSNVYATPRAKDLVPLLKECQKKFYLLCVQKLGKDKMGSLTGSLCALADTLSDDMVPL